MTTTQQLDFLTHAYKLLPRGISWPHLMPDGEGSWMVTRCKHWSEAYGDSPLSVLLASCLANQKMDEETTQHGGVIWIKVIEYLNENQE